MSASDGTPYGSQFWCEKTMVLLDFDVVRVYRHIWEVQGWEDFDDDVN